MEQSLELTGTAIPSCRNVNRIRVLMRRDPRVILTRPGTPADVVRQRLPPEAVVEKRPARHGNRPPRHGNRTSSVPDQESASLEGKEPDLVERRRLPVETDRSARVCRGSTSDGCAPSIR